VLIYPFRGILYNKKEIKDFKNVYSPPYDIISNVQQDEYYKKSPYNVIRLELNKKTEADNEQDNIYTRAAGFLKEWLGEGILKLDDKPTIYVYGQSFKHNKKIRHTLGFIAAAKIEQSRHSQVRPHEMTFKAPKEDREKVLDIVKANLSCIYTLVEDNGLKINKLLRSASRVKPFIDVKIDDVRHRIWKVQGSSVIKTVQKLMSFKKVFIADGHHRYEAAANFRDKMAGLEKNFSDKSPYNYIMMYFTSMEDKNLTILATHRVVKDFNVGAIHELPLHFDVVPVSNKKKMFEMLDKYFGKEHVFGMYYNGKFSVLKLKNNVGADLCVCPTQGDHRGSPLLDVSILHDLILNNVHDIFYTRDPNEAIGLIDKKEYKTAFFLNPTLATQIKDISLAGGKMPHKSTYFYPKLLTGLVMRKL